LNLLLLDSKVSVLSLAKDDLRAVHLRSVLDVKTGDEIDVAVKNGPRGKGKVSLLPDQRVDLAIRWADHHPCDLFPIHLIVGFARPQTCRKILEQASSLGVERISFFQAEKGEPSYAKSRLWTTSEWMERIDRGVEQAFASFVPTCELHATLAQALSSARSESTFKIALDNYEAAKPLTAEGVGGKRPIVLALGPERGWSSSERKLLRSQSFELRHLGKRVLRMETAVVASLGVMLAGYWLDADPETL
jgi:RsmE family RNA methyltransferase